MTTLVLIRHATNDWVKRRLAGWTPGIHLNQEGQQQAQALAERLRSIPLAAIYSSPLERALETAQAIATRQELPVQILEGVGEVHYGDWTGGEIRTLSEHTLWTTIQFYPSGARFPNGETFGEVQMRALTTIETIRTQHMDHQVIAVVSHADVIKLVVAHYIGMHMDLFQRLVIHPASITVLAFNTGPRLVAFNDTGSLDYFTLLTHNPSEQSVQPMQE